MSLVKKDQQENLEGIVTRDELVELVCRGWCEFFREDEREMECGAFKVLQGLLQQGIIAAGDLQRVTDN